MGSATRQVELCVGRIRKTEKDPNFLTICRIRIGSNLIWVIFADMTKEILKIRTAGVSGVESDFLVDGAACELHAYDYVAQRMGSHTITCTVKSRECLDSRWSGREFVEYGGQRYVLDGTPSSSKDSTDHRYSHSITFILELDKVLSGTIFLDAVAVGEVSDRPRTNTTSFSFYGTIREFSARLNKVMEYSGLGVASRVDDEIPEGDSLLVSFDDRTVLEAIQDAYSVYGVPYWYDLSGEKPAVVFGHVHHAVTTPLKYGVDSPLMKVSRTNAGSKAVNRCSGYGSEENIPYYYPNLSPEGELEVTTNRDALVVRIADPAKASRLVGKTLRYLSETPVATVQKCWFTFSGQTWDNRVVTAGNENESVLNVGDMGYATPEISGLEHAIPIVVGTYYTNTKMFSMYIRFFASAPCTVTADIVLAYGKGYGQREDSEHKSIVSLYDSEGKRLGTAYYNKIKIPAAGTYEIVANNGRDSLKEGLTVRSDDKFLYWFKSFTVSGGTAFYWKLGDDTVNLSDYGLEIVSGTPQEGDSIVVSVKVLEEGVRKFPVSARLLPYLYRETLGKGRFYDAVNAKETFVSRYRSIYPETADLEAVYDRIYGSGEGHLEFLNGIECSTAAVEHIAEFDEIKPTIEGMENASGQPMNAILAVGFDEKDDDSTTGDDDSAFSHPNFFVKLPKFDGDDGFNLFDHALEGGTVEIHMTSGACAGCTFPVIVAKDGRTNLVQADGDGNLLRDDKGDVVFGDSGQDVQNDTEKHEVWICLEKDNSTYDELIPCKGKYEPETGDTFVITGISLPHQYVCAAEKRLERAIVEHLLENNAEKFTYGVSFSRVFTASDKSVMPVLDENSSVIVEYDGRQETMYVSQYTLRAASDNAIPEVSVTITEQVSDSVDPIRQAVAQAKSDVAQAVAGIDVTKLGLPYFLRKDIEDIAKGVPTFLNGAKFGNYTPGLLGTGGVIGVDSFGNTTAEVDFLNVRKKANFNEIDVQKTSGVGGELVVSCAASEIASVEEHDDFYRCFLKVSDGNGDDAFNLFAVGDLVRAQSFDSLAPVFWWRKAVEVGSDYVDLSKSACAEGSGVPRAGENIVQLGNTDDSSRRGAQVLSCYGTNAPAFRIYDGISDFSLEGCLRSGFETIGGKAVFFVYGRGYIGDAERKQYIESEDGKLTVTGLINALGGVMSGLLAVEDSEGNLKAGFSGGEQGRSDTHGRMVMFAGADSSQSDTDSRIEGSATKIYEDGHLLTQSAEIEGKVTSDSGNIGGFEISDDTLENRSETRGYNPTTGKTEVLSYWGLRLTTAIIELYSSAYQNWTTNLRMQSYPTPSSGGFEQVNLQSSVTGSKAPTAGRKRIGVGIEASASGADVDYAFRSQSGMFAGLRPKAIVLTGAKQIGIEENSISGSDTLRDIDHTVIANCTSGLTLNLPASPKNGQHYEITQIHDGVRITISGNGKNIHFVSRNGGALTATSHFIDGRCKIWLDWVGEIWYMTHNAW